jgi:hypothetical protein
MALEQQLQTLLVQATSRHRIALQDREPCKAQSLVDAIHFHLLAGRHAVFQKVPRCLQLALLKVQQPQQSELK